MKTIKILSFFLLVCSFACAQPIRFMRTYGFSNHDLLHAKPTPDGGYILFGGKNYNSSSEDILIIKTDSAGAITWSKTYGTVDGEEVWGLEILSNGYLISAQTDTGSGCRFLFKIDLAGNIVWMKTNFFAWNMVVTSNGGFIVASPGDSTTGVITKLDSNCNVVWRKKYNVPGAYGTYSLTKAVDGGFFISGMMLHGFGGNLDFNLTKTDSMGNVLWSRMYGGNNDEWFPELDATFDGGCIMAGSTWSFGAGYDDALLIKVDATGNVQWAKTFGGALGDDGGFVKQTFGSIGYILTGNTQGFSNDVDDSACTCSTRSFMIKIDINGNFQWARRYGIGPQDNGGVVHETQDAGYVLSGSTAGWGAGGLEGWMIKTDNLGISGCYDWATTPFVTSPTVLDSSLTFTESNDTVIMGTGTLLDSLSTPFTTIECSSVAIGIEEHVNRNEINIFPNPTIGNITINTSNLKDASHFSIYNSIGQILLSQKISDIQTSVDMNNFPSGIYLIRVSTKNNEVLSRKIIKE